MVSEKLSPLGLGINLAEKGMVPDWLISIGIRGLLGQRTKELRRSTPYHQQKVREQLLHQLKADRLAIETEAANEQHYEVPTEFFKMCLGARLKYSCCYYKSRYDDLDRAEENMLDIYCKRAKLAQGQSILELGCGWGSLTLWMAEKYPDAQITAVSNSSSQREHINSLCKEKGFDNVKVITCDVNNLQLEEGQFDRVVSIEMFEHMRNYQNLFRNISRWMKDDALMFVHIFCHGTTPYLFETEGEHNWMGKYFFTGGIMPSEDLFHYFQEDLLLAKQWRVNGQHYEKTARHWLENMDQHEEEIIELFDETYGEDQGVKWFHRWRIFYLSCAELWGYKEGKEWWVGHYLFHKRP